MKTTGKQKDNLPLQLSSRLKNRLMRYENVTDVGIGVSMKDGKFTTSSAIVVYVTEKLPKDKLTAGSLIPCKISGMPTDVQEELEAEFFKLNDNTGFDLSRVRPLVSGIVLSSSSAPDHGGTLGCFATRNSDGKKVLISNYHVLFRNMDLPEIVEGENRIYQPLEGEHNLVAKLPATNAGSIGGALDCGYAVLEEEGSSCCCKHTIAHENKVGTTPFVGIASAVKEQKVFKKGIASGTTVGKIVNVSKAIGTIDYSEYFLPAGSSFDFSNIIMIVYWDEAADNYDPTKQFSVGGDSGSAVYNENHEIVGIHFASHHSTTTGRHYSFACHIELVETALGVTVPGTRNLVAAAAPVGSAATAALDVPIDSSDGDFVIAGTPSHAAIEEPDLWLSFHEQLQRTEFGKQMLHIIYMHGFEIMRLINHNREVTVTWHRKQGPSYTAAIIRSMKNSDYSIPTEIKGQPFTELLTQICLVLHRNGSRELQQTIEIYEPILFELAGRIGPQATFSDIIEQMENYKVNQTPQANGRQ